MAIRRLWAVILGVWGLDLLMLALFPFLRLLIHLPLLLLLFLGFRFPLGSRTLGLVGLGLGLLRDLSSGGFFGTWACALGLTGWIVAQVRPSVETEDSFLLAVWVGISTLGALLLHGVVTTLADPGLSFRQGPWAVFPFSMAAHAGIAAWGSNRLHKFLCGSNSFSV